MIMVKNMLEIYNFIINNLKEYNDIYKTYISFTKVNNKDLALIPNKIMYINKDSVINLLIELGFNIESLVIDKMEILYISITKDKLLDEKKYQK